jgi:hypothetical protein
MSSQLEGFRALVGEWTTEAIHPSLPDTVVPGHTSVEWLEGEQFADPPGHQERLSSSSVAPMRSISRADLSNHR